MTGYTDYIHMNEIKKKKRLICAFPTAVTRANEK